MSLHAPLFTALLTLALLPAIFTLQTHLKHSPSPQDVLPTTTHKVPLEIHIMSKCPDAKDCLEQLIAPAMDEINDIVDFRISFIGRPTESGISCMHGPSECLSNALHLCAMRLYPAPSVFLPFSLCLIHNYTLLPSQEFIESCAEKHDISFDKLNECISSLEPDGGLELLRKSVERSRDVGAEVSCTVRVEEEVWCVRDGGKWKHCREGKKPEDLVRKVRELHKKREGRGPGMVKQAGEGLWGG